MGSLDKKKKRAKKIQEKRKISREFLIKKRKEQKELARADFYRDKQVPYMKQETLEKRGVIVERHLENNLRMLEQLYEEFLEQNKNREEINSRLEELGAKTVEEKIKLIQRYTQEGKVLLPKPAKKKGRFSGGFDVKFTPNE